MYYGEEACVHKTAPAIMSKTPRSPGKRGTPSPRRWSTRAFAARLTPFAKGTATERSPEPRALAKRKLPLRFKLCGTMKAGVTMWEMNVSNAARPVKLETQLISRM